MSEWCPICCTQHQPVAPCPGELQATGAERHGWRVNVETGRGIEAYGVIVAETANGWRARILTYPNILWLVPRGKGTIKFFAPAPDEAERKAVAFVRRHCNERGYTMRDGLVRAEPQAFSREALPRLAAPTVEIAPAERKIRFLPVRFGVVRPSEPGGTGNLSETGMFIITSLPVNEGEALRLMLPLEKKELQLSGSVCWMRREHHAGRSPGMGVKLDQPPREYVDYVRALA